MASVVSYYLCKWLDTIITLMSTSPSVFLSNTTKRKPPEIPPLGVFVLQLNKLKTSTFIIMKSTNPVNSQLTAGGPPSPADSDAAARRQPQNDDIASSNPRLVKK